MLPMQSIMELMVGGYPVFIIPNGYRNTGAACQSHHVCCPYWRTPYEQQRLRYVPVTAACRGSAAGVLWPGPLPWEDVVM